MNINAETLTVNGIEYVKKDSVTQYPLAAMVDGLEYKIFRTYTAGVFAGYQKSRNGQEAVVINARRLWKWSGAASLSQLATEGTKNPSDCKFPCEVSKIELTQVIEVLDVTEKSRKSISEVPVWQM